MNKNWEVGLLLTGKSMADATGETKVITLGDASTKEDVKQAVNRMNFGGKRVEILAIREVPASYKNKTFSKYRSGD